jgi:RNA recognition motif-containing protein
MRLYVGNLPYDTTSEELERLFGEYGTVSDAVVVMDRDTGRSKGFGFVEMPSDQEGQAAMQELDGSQMGGRGLKVNEARPPAERSSRY